jgi:aminoglycoside phosphotransferase family enzyme
MPDASDAPPELIRSLGDPACYDHPAGPVRHLETHISHILLTGDYAYKVKKPLDLGFLDFSTLAKRLHACEEEVQLNRRLAPAIYLGVVPITGSPAAPRVNGSGDAFEYAVKMRQFPADATLDRLDASGGPSAEQVEAIARTIARFHLHDCARAPDDSPWGTPEKVWYPMGENFEHIAPLLADPARRAQLDAVHAWSAAEHARLSPLLAARKRDGFVRECHGDLHLGNLAWVDGGLLVFDCIEFNPELRWIDIQSEIAFCYMDLLQRCHAEWAWLFLNLWLDKTGDYEGLSLLRYYAVYRAMVRAKVAAIRMAQLAGNEREAALKEVRSLLGLAMKLRNSMPVSLMITMACRVRARARSRRGSCRSRARSGCVRMSSASAWLAWRHSPGLVPVSARSCTHQTPRGRPTAGWPSWPARCSMPAGR